MEVHGQRVLQIDFILFWLYKLLMTGDWMCFCSRREDNILKIYISKIKNLNNFIFPIANLEYSVYMYNVYWDHFWTFANPINFSSYILLVLVMKHVNCTCEKWM